MNQTVTQMLVVRTRGLINQVKFLDYKFVVTETQRGEVYLRGEYDEPDTYTSKPALQHTRRWLLSPHMTDSEIVQTLFKCCITSMEHRTREAFQFQGARIFGPHFDVYDLVSLCKDGYENAGGRSTGVPA